VVGDKLVLQTYAGAAAAGRPANAFVAGFRIDPDSQGSATSLTTQTVELSGAKATGDIWTITLNGTAYAYTAAAADDLAAIARALQIKIGQQQRLHRDSAQSRADHHGARTARPSPWPRAPPTRRGKAIVDASTQFKLAGTRRSAKSGARAERHRRRQRRRRLRTRVVRRGSGGDRAGLQQKIVANGGYRASVVGRAVTVERLVGRCPSPPSVGINRDSPGAASVWRSSVHRRQLDDARSRSACSRSTTPARRRRRQGGASLDREGVNLIRGPVALIGGIKVTAEAFLDNPLSCGREQTSWCRRHADGFRRAKANGSRPSPMRMPLTVDPVRGVMSGFDRGSTTFTYSFTLFDSATRATAAEKLSDSLSGHRDHGEAGGRNLQAYPQTVA